MSERLARDILKRIDEDFDDHAARQEVKTRLRSLWDTDLNVGAEQLARAILIVSAGDLDQFGCVFDTHFYGDPRDLIMAAMGKSGGQAKYGVEPF